MTLNPVRSLTLALAVTAGAAALFVSDHVVLDKPDTIISSAEARVGRPLTPLSYAGVARRTTRRAVVGGAVVGGAVVGGVVVVTPRPGCIQVVNSYGQLYWRCP